MKKATVNMTNWELNINRENAYYLCGTADYHPRMGKNAYVSHTSEMVDYSFSEDELTFETRNTVYVCPLKYMTVYPFHYKNPDYVEELSHRADSSDNTLDQIISSEAKIALENDRKKQSSDETKEHLFTDDEFVLKIKELQRSGQFEIEKMKQEEKERLISISKQYEDCVYIEVSNIDNGNTLAYHFGEMTGIVEPYVHGGMFQDSVLYTENGVLDFRYWPRRAGIETYSWSDNIRQVVIKNDTGKVLTFNHVDLAEGETIVFTPDSHRQGLISPDSYNGKSAFLTEQDIQKRQTDSLHVSEELKSQYEEVTKRKADESEYQKLLCLYYDENWTDICMHYTIEENRKALDKAVGFVLKELQDRTKEPFEDDTEIEWVPIPEEGPKDWEKRLSDFVRCEILNNSES